MATIRTVDKKKIEVEVGGAKLEEEISHVAASEVPMVKLKRGQRRVRLGQRPSHRFVRGRRKPGSQPGGGGRRWALFPLGQYHLSRAKPPKTTRPISATIRPAQKLQTNIKTIPTMTRIPPSEIPMTLSSLDSFALSAL
jgi:hypothetical protein